MKDTLFPLSGDELLHVAKKQARPRRWPWQPKTVRDHIHDWGADMSELAAAQGEVLLRYVREQARPRRWPWQPKTLRDHIDGRSAELAALAAERSAELADLVAYRSAELAAPLNERAQKLLKEAQRQSRPRRWLWQKKTVRDKLNKQSAKLAAQASKRSNELAAQALARRDQLLKEAQRQAKPRRWPWQKKTARDKINERVALLKSTASDQASLVAGLTNETLDSAKQRGLNVYNELQHQAQPRRWPWQEKTARDKLNEQVAHLQAGASDWQATAKEQFEAAKEAGSHVLSEAQQQAQDRAAELQSKASDLQGKAKKVGSKALKEVQHQAEPRRWPWQEKTARDKLNDQLSSLQAGASDWQGAAQEKLAAAQEAGANALSELQHQAEPSRWPWQQKTARDKLNEQLSNLQSSASDWQGAAQEKLAAAQEAGANALSELQYQAEPSRWPWQQKTARDKLNDQLSSLQAGASDWQSAAQEKLAAAQEAGANALSELQHQAEPRRWPWQQKTARDKLNDQLSNLQSSAGDAGNKLQHVAALGAGAAAAGVAYAASRGQQVADQVQHAAASVPDAISSTAASVGDSVKDTAKQVAKQANKTKRAAKAAVSSPVNALNNKVQYGKLSVNHGVSLVKTAIRWAIIGFIIGVLTSPTSGRELRRQIRDTVVRVIDSILKPS
jgi:gas vesicle protein